MKNIPEENYRMVTSSGVMEAHLNVMQILINKKYSTPMNEQDSWTCDAMEKYGGSFVRQLAVLCRSADMLNLAKLKRTFRRYWNDYELMGKKMQIAADEKTP